MKGTADDGLLKLCQNLCRCSFEASASHSITYMENGAEHCPDFSPLTITGDLVEVVRCEKCKRYTRGFIKSDHGWCDEWDTAVRSSGYCHHGERKTEDG